MAITHKDVLAANRRAAIMKATTPAVVAAHYNPKAKRIVMRMSSGIEVMFNPQDVQGLDTATPAQLKEIEITPSGFALFFPALEEGVNVPNLLEGTMGSAKWMAARLGARGGKSRSLPKRAAARANGSLGGRPRKVSAR